MSVVVIEENQTKFVLNQARLDKVKNLLGAKSESETLELALEKIIDEFELKNTIEEVEALGKGGDRPYRLADQALYRVRALHL